MDLRIEDPFLPNPSHIEREHKEGDETCVDREQCPVEEQQEQARILCWILSAARVKAARTAQAERILTGDVPVSSPANAAI